MMQIALNATSQSIDIRIVDDSGLPVPSLVADTLPTLVYSKAGANADVTITPVDLASLATAWTSSGVKERGNGVYRLDLPNAMLTTQARVTIRGEATDKRVICPTIDVGMLVGADVTFAPTSTQINERVTASTITCYHGETGFTIGPNAVTDANGGAVDISTANYTSLKFVVEDQYKTDLFSTTSVTVSGAGNNQWTVTGTSAFTGTSPAKLAWSLRGLNSGVEVLLGLGDVVVANAARSDS
jgi:hypothetical protein